jgi:hypothetical protein
MGNLDATPFAEAWHSPAFRRLREAHLARDVRGTACAECIGYRQPVIRGEDAR